MTSKQNDEEQESNRFNTSSAFFIREKNVKRETYIYKKKLRSFFFVYYH